MSLPGTWPHATRDAHEGLPGDTVGSTVRGARHVVLRRALKQQESQKILSINLSVPHGEWLETSKP